jgi:prophage maintenance system killer protein
MNGIEVNADENSFERMVLLTAEGKVDKAAIAQFFKNNSGNTAEKD